MFTGEKIRDIWFSDVSIKFLAHSSFSFNGHMIWAIL